MMKFAVVTPCLNRAKYLDEAIESVVSQEGDFAIDYIIQDGGSDDAVGDIVSAWQKRIEEKEYTPRCRELRFRWFRQPDEGMYDAINIGFSKAEGDIMCWLNTDDRYHSHSFETISRVFSLFDDVHWLTGIPNSYNHYGAKAGMDLFPSAYSRQFIARGYYDVHFLPYGLNWIQQESSFWRRGLWERVGGRLDTSLRYAADFRLWQSFARHTDLVKVYSLLGGYRCHGDQITGDPANYRGELGERGVPPRGLKILHGLLSSVPSLRRLIFNKREGAPFLGMLGLEWDWVVGRAITWSYEEQQWLMQLKAVL